MDNGHDVLTERAVTAYTEVTAAAFAVVQSKLWKWEERRWTEVDLDPLGRTLEDVAVASAYYANADVTDALNHLLDVNAQFLSEVASLRKLANAGASGMLSHQLRPQYAEAVAKFETALTDYVRATQRQLGIQSSWKPVRRAIDRHMTDVRQTA